MKKLILLICTMAFFAASNWGIAKPTPRQSVAKDSVLLLTSEELVNVANQWARAYEKEHQETKILVSNVAADQVANTLKSSKNLILTTKNIYPDIEHNEMWKIPVGRDILVPVINKNNPYLNKIASRGISPEKLSEVFQNNGKLTWGSILENNEKTPVNLYYCAEANQNTHLSKFLHSDISAHKSDYHNTNKVLDAVNKDPYAVGFCNILDVINPESLKINEGLSFIPIDLNKNNKIDFFEDIYKNAEELERAVWIGKYPKSLYSDLYIVSESIPVESNKNEFLKWVISEGQQHLSSLGYSELVYSEKLSKMQKLYENPVALNNISKPKHGVSTFIILLIIIGIISIPIIAVTYLRKRKSKPVKRINSIPHFFSEANVSAPKGLFYDKSHTWAFMEKDGNVRIGIADFLQHITGNITKVKMRKPGEMINKGEPFLTIIQDGKQLDIPSPVSGKIKEFNRNLDSNTSIINTAPYSEGWIYLVESVNWIKEINSYFISDSYKTWLSKEFIRLKDFLASATRLNSNNNLQVVFQDGGELADKPMENFGPAIWEEFQSEFINKSK